MFRNLFYFTATIFLLIKMVPQVDAMSAVLYDLTYEKYAVESGLWVND